MFSLKSGSFHSVHINTEITQTPCLNISIMATVTTLWIHHAPVLISIELQRNLCHSTRGIWRIFQTPICDIAILSSGLILPKFKTTGGKRKVHSQISPYSLFMSSSSMIMSKQSRMLVGRPGTIMLHMRLWFHSWTIWGLGVEEGYSDWTLRCASQRMWREWEKIVNWN